MLHVAIKSSHSFSREASAPRGNYLPSEEGLGPLLLGDLTSLP